MAFAAVAAPTRADETARCGQTHRPLRARDRPANNQWKSADDWFTLDCVHVRLYASPDDFGPVARWVYRRDPVLFTTELTTLRTSRWPDGHVLLSVADCDGTVGAALQTRDAILLVSGLPPESAKAAAAALAPMRPDLPAIRGTASSASTFSQTWTEVADVSASVDFQEIL